MEPGSLLPGSQQPVPVPILSQINPVQALYPISLRSNFSLSYTFPYRNDVPISPVHRLSHMLCYLLSVLHFFFLSGVSITASFSITGFCGVTTCTLVDQYQYFGENVP